MINVFLALIILVFFYTIKKIHIYTFRYIVRLSPDAGIRESGNFVMNFLNIDVYYI